MRIFGRVRHRPSATWRQATDRAFTLIDDGRYEDAGALLIRAADLEPWLSESWFNLALLHKFRHDWEQARAAGLRAVALLDRRRRRPRLVERRHRGHRPAGLAAGPPRLAGVRAADAGRRVRRVRRRSRSAWRWAARRCGSRRRARPRWSGAAGWTRPGSRCSSIPLPSSGRRWGEVVLHDGVPHGERVRGRRRRRYPVFDEIELWAPSPVPTWLVLLEAATEADRDALERLAADAGLRGRGLVVLGAAAVPDLFGEPDADRRRLAASTATRTTTVSPVTPATCRHRSAGALWVARAGVRHRRAGRAGARPAGRLGGRQPGHPGLAGSRRGLLTALRRRPGTLDGHDRCHW